VVLEDQRWPEFQERIMRGVVTKLGSVLLVLLSGKNLYANDYLLTREQLQRMAGAATRPLARQLYTPSQGNSERSAIIDAIRLATGWNVKFRVEHLVVARAGSKALAIAEVTDASNKTEDVGIFELEGLNSQ
jgi:hypothetical protein